MEVHVWLGPMKLGIWRPIEGNAALFVEPAAKKLCAFMLNLSNKKIPFGFFVEQKDPRVVIKRSVWLSQS